MTAGLWDRETFAENLRAIGARAYHDQHLFPGVRFAVDAYVNFARTEPWPIAIASSLTELFAPYLMATRLAAFEKFYQWIDPRGLDYFRRRVAQARGDADEALAITLEYCNTPELQRGAIRALNFKCDALWSMLDAIHHAYGGNDNLRCCSSAPSERSPVTDGLCNRQKSTAFPGRHRRIKRNRPRNSFSVRRANIDRK